MNYSLLVKRVANNAGVTHEVARDVVSALFEEVKSLEVGDKVALPSIGVFSHVAKPSRQGRNPATGETLTIDAKEVITFKFSKKYQ